MLYPLHAVSALECFEAKHMAKLDIVKLALCRLYIDWIMACRDFVRLLKFLQILRSFSERERESITFRTAASLRRRSTPFLVRSRAKSNRRTSESEFQEPNRARE